MAHPIRAYRERQRPPVSQAELARMLGVTRGTVCRWESGVRLPHEDMLPIIAEKLHIDPGVLRPDLVRALQPFEGAYE